MLMKYAKVSREGKYTPPPPSNSKASYSTMVYVRATIVEDAGWHLARAATISVSPPQLSSPYQSRPFWNSKWAFLYSTSVDQYCFEAPCKATLHLCEASLCQVAKIRDL